MALRLKTGSFLIASSIFLLQIPCSSESQQQPDTEQKAKSPAGNGPDLEEYARTMGAGFAVLNNSGVTAMKAHKFEQAKQYFLSALKQDPSYKYARENLA